jgi:membrane-associated phospholipid phosphatase
VTACSVAIAATSPVQAEQRAEPQCTENVVPAAMPSPLDAVGEDALRAVSGWQWLYLAGAVAATAAMSPSGADHAIRVGIQEHARLPAWGDAAYYGGYVLPVVAPASIYVAGLVARDHDVAGAGSAAIQALVFTELVTVVLKVGTGRPFPSHGGDPNAPDRLNHPEYAHEWAPFGFAGRYAWPSGHTAAAVSVAAALTAYSENPWLVGSIAYPVAGAIAFGMLTGDHHWASDVVAGALIAQGIGWSVGKSFAARVRPSSSLADRVTVVPVLSSEVRGIAIVGAF